MSFYVRKQVDGLEMWLKRTSPFIAWGPREQAQKFVTRREAIVACSRAGVDPSHVTIIAEGSIETQTARQP